MSATPTGVTVVIPTLNGGELLRRCLKSLVEQDLPVDRREVLVVDGGSTDGSRELATELECEVLDNPLRLAEPGVRIGLDRARHDVRVVMAADNALPGRDWLSRILGVFADADVRGVYTHVVDDPIDSAFCRYFNGLHADPFNWFVYGRAAQPDRFGEVYPEIERGADYVVYDLAAGDPPLLALAQGFAVRGPLPGGRNEQDDILPIWQMLEQGERLAYVPLGILHHTVGGFRDFLRKYDRRIRLAFSFADAGQHQRAGRLSRRRRLRRLAFIPYGLLVVPAAVDAVRHARRDPDPVWLFHPPACACLSALIVRAALRSALVSAQGRRR